jgi:predicted nucleic acid-binding protein
LKYLVDTDLIVDHISGRPDAIALLRRLVNDGLGISLMTFGELYEGVFGSDDVESSEKAFLDILKWIAVAPLDEAIMRRFAAVRRDLRDRGQLIPDSDLLIAATALERGLTLVTRNIKHFGRIDDLSIYEQASARQSPRKV